MAEKYIGKGESVLLPSWEDLCLLPENVSDLAVCLAVSHAASSSEDVQVAGTHRRQVEKYDLSIPNTQLYWREDKVEKV